MKCCEQHSPESDLSKTKDKFLTYLLIGLVIVTVVVGYFVVSNKNETKGKNVKGAAVQDDMSSHHGGGNKKFEPLVVGTIAPDFSLPSTAGTTVSLSTYKGRHVLLFFNEGVMCSPCWQEISRLERFKDEFAQLNAVIIPISVDDQKTWEPILREEKITTPILIDSDRKRHNCKKVRLKILL